MAHSAIIDRILALLERTPPFDRLEEAERRSLLADVSMQFYETGEVILEQRSTLRKGLYIVESGLVRLMDVEGQRLVDRCGEGDVFGSFGLIKGGASVYEAKAVEPTVCMVLSSERFTRLYDTNEAFASFFNQDLKQYLNRVGSRLDVTGSQLLLTRRLHQFTNRNLVTCEPDTTAQEAARLMRRRGVDSIIVLHHGRAAGILTDSDLRNRVVAAGRSLDTPVRRLMSSPVHTVSDEARLLDAMMMMLRQRVDRLVVTREKDDRQTLVGLVTDRDLAHLRGQDPVATLQRIHHASSPDELASVRTEAGDQILNMYRQGVQPETLNLMVSLLYDWLMVRVLQLAEQTLRREGQEERVNLKWIWLRLGYVGRRETGLSSEKYGAIVYENPATEAEGVRAARWFGRLYKRANATLEACGFRTSDEAIQDLQRYLPVREWKRTYRTWIFEADPASLDRFAPFFDLRGVYGEASLVDVLRQDLDDALNVQAMDRERNFLGLLMAQALEHRPPLSFFRRLVFDRSGQQRQMLNLRDRGIRPLVDTARVLALELRYFDSTNTLDRFRYALDHLPELAEPLGQGLEAYRFLSDFRLTQQLHAVEAHEPVADLVDPSSLTRVQRNLLRAAFQASAGLQEAVARRYNLQRKWFS